MKRFMNFLKRHTGKTAAIVVAGLAVAGLTSAAIAGFGPDRATKPWNPQENGFNYVTFNSYTGVPNGIGDERDFARGVVAGRDSTWTDPVQNVQATDEVEVKLYVHNNADPNMNADGSGIAKNVHVRATLPTDQKANQTITSYISADNAQPKEIFDTLDISGANNAALALNYVLGSAKMFDHETGQTTALADSLVTTGVNIGDQKGCFQYMREITFRVKASIPGYFVEKTVRMKGQGPNDWKESITAKPGDEVEWRIKFLNTGTTQLNKVVLLDQVPEGTTVTPGTIELVNSNNPNGFKFGSDALQAGGRQVNTQIGDYAPQGGAWLYFFSKVDPLECGTKTLVNKVYATPEGSHTITDDANIIVDTGKECTQPKPDFSIVKDVRKKADTNWMQDVTVQYGDTVEYRIVVKNTGDTDLKNVLVKDQRPTGVDYLDGTLKVNGQAATGDLFGAGVTIPEIKKGQQAEITFDAKVNKGQTGECEVKKFRNIASATPEGLQPKEDDANVNTECKEQPPVPSYECTVLEAAHLGDWNFKFTTTVKMSEGVTVNKYTYNFGDNTAELNTDKNVVEHKYGKPGEYNASVRVLFNVGNEQKEARCTVKITIPKDNCPIPGKEHLPKDSPDCKEVPVVPGNPVTPVGTTPKGVDFVPATGPAEIVAGVFGTSATAYGAYALAMSRRTLKNLHK